MFRATMCPSSGETTVFVCGWQPGMHTTQSSTQNNKYQVSKKHSCFSWWWAHSRPKHVEIYKYTKNELCTKLVLFTRLYRDARSTKHKRNLFLCDFMCCCSLDALSVTQNCLDDVMQFVQIRSDMPTVLPSNTVLTTANSNTACMVKRACAIYRAKIPPTCLWSLELNFIASSIFAIFALRANDSPYT